MYTVLYFTSRKHLTYLRLSLRSWKNSHELSNVQLFEINLDSNGEDIFEELADIVFPIPLRVTETDEIMSRSGINVVRNEIRAFQRAATQMRDGWIIKIDSDVLVTQSTMAFEHSQSSNASIFGNKCRNYIQGGVYFLKCEEVWRLCQRPIESCSMVTRSSEHCPEDGVICEQMRHAGGRLEAIRIAWNEPQIAQISMEACARISFLHFRGKTKYRMGDAFQLLESNKLNCR